MKKKTILFLLPVTTLLISCNRGGGSSLPKGHIQDLSSEQNVRKLESRLAKSGTTLVDKLNSIKCVASINKFSFDEEIKNSTTETCVSLKDVKGSITAQVEDLYSPIKDIKAYVGINNLAFTVDTSVKVSDNQQTNTLKYDPMSISAYKKDNYIYGDFSDKNISTFISEFFDLVNSPSTGTMVSYVLGETGKIKMDLSSLIDEAIMNQPVVTKEVLGAYTTEYVSNLLESIKESKYQGLEYIEYDNGEYAIQFDAMKMLKSSMEDFESLDLKDGELDANLGILFANDYSLKNIYLTGNVDKTMTSGEGEYAVTIALKGELDFSFSFSYNEKISFPSFTDYVDFNLK